MSLAKHLETSKEVITEFVALLEEEQRVLASSQIDGQAIVDLANRKNAIVERLRQLEQVRNLVQQRKGYPDGLPGARQAAKDDGCSALWDEILVLSTRAKNLNELNGMQVSMHMEQNRKRLAFLNKASDAQIYGRDGKSQRKRLGGISTRA